MVKKPTVNKRNTTEKKRTIKAKLLTPRLTFTSFPIVGVGASAGGLEAYTGFISKLPPQTGMAFILIQHLDPSQPSRLTELLSNSTQIPINEVKTNTAIEPNHIYVIPPGSDMTLREGYLVLQKHDDIPGAANAIDIFFNSLAEGAKEKGVAIILSGTGSDGTKGAAAVKAARGLVIIQDPKTAKYDGMPRAAISAGLGDYVLKPEEMGNKIIEYYHKSLTQRRQIQNAVEKDGTGIRNILSLIHIRTGRDFSGYKMSSITRRIQHRMAVNRFDKNIEYLRYLKEQPAEIEELMNDFLINVTSFFRDKPAFTALKNNICEILKTKPEDQPVRVWIPGCSTGEEAYSIAMLLMECQEASKKHHDIQLFGTDLDTDTILFARAGVYPAAIAKDVSPERLKKFFNRVDTSYQVKKDLREKIVFAVHDLVADPPYSRMDIVSVRNLLIYFDNDLQQKIIQLLHYSLNEGGILFLGAAETVGNVPDFFKTVDSKWRIYRSINKDKAQHTILTSPKSSWKPADTSLLPVIQQPKNLTAAQLLLEALPPSVLIDRNYQVIFTHENTAKYLHLPEGNPSTGILEMANADLRAGLAIALHEASHEHKETVREIAIIKNTGGSQIVKVTVRPLRKTDGSLIVTFQDEMPPKHRKEKSEHLSEAKYIELQQELQFTKETLHSTIEELETTNEELRSANEEFMSTNEELKSANEELETSREELRSVNEELTTINTEREKKIDELTAVSDDMRNLLNSTEIATIFLDHKLRIRRFTPAITKIFKLINSDVGRPLEDIVSSLKTEGLPQAARRVLDTLIPTEQDVKTKDGHWYSMKIHPYRTADNAIEGVVATFVDINKIKAAVSYNQSIVDSVREPMLVLDEELKVISASRAFYKKFLVTKKETERQFFYELGNRQWDIPQLKDVLKAVVQKGKVFEGFRLEYIFPGIGEKVMLLNARRIFDGIRATNSILLTLEDVTGQPDVAGFSQTKDSRKGKTSG